MSQCSCRRLYNYCSKVGGKSGNPAISSLVLDDAIDDLPIVHYSHINCWIPLNVNCLCSRKIDRCYFNAWFPDKFQAMSAAPAIQHHSHRRPFCGSLRCPNAGEDNNAQQRRADHGVNQARLTGRRQHSFMPAL